MIPEELDNMTPVCPEGFTQMQLHEAFAMIEDKKHWKNPINTVVADHFLPIARAACMFYTVTDLDSTPDSEGRVRITSIGYREGPAGP